MARPITTRGKNVHTRVSNKVVALASKSEFTAADLGVRGVKAVELNNALNKISRETGSVIKASTTKTTPGRGRKAVVWKRVG